MDPLPGTSATRAVGATATRAPARAGGGFSVGEGSAAGRPAAVADVSLAGLLALQEAGGEAVQDRAARRQGQTLLAELAALQRDLLAGPPDPDRLARLAGLADGMPAAVDPHLQDIVVAIATRARIEIARYATD